LAKPDAAYTYWLVVVGADGTSIEVELQQLDNLNDASKVFLPLVNN